MLMIGPSLCTAKRHVCPKTIVMAVNFRRLSCKEGKFMAS